MTIDKFKILCYNVVTVKGRTTEQNKFKKKKEVLYYENVKERFY